MWFYAGNWYTAIGELDLISVKKVQVKLGCDLDCAVTTRFATA